MSDRESIEYDIIQEAIAEELWWDEASKESALEQCIYLFVEGESEETAFRILLEEGLDINFLEYGIIIANYNGIGNLRNVTRLMNLTLSHERPIIFTFDDDDPSLVPDSSNLPSNMHLFKIPFQPVVTFSNGYKGGSFEESFEESTFINACFETTLLKANPQIIKQDFINIFDSNKPFYSQIVNFLKQKGLTSSVPKKIEIAEEMAVTCIPEPDTYIRLAQLIKNIRSKHPVRVKM